jgi:hypothetical protein
VENEARIYVRGAGKNQKSDEATEDGDRVIRRMPLGLPNLSCEKRKDEIGKKYKAQSIKPK